MDLLALILSHGTQWRPNEGFAQNLNVRCWNCCTNSLCQNGNDVVVTNQNALMNLNCENLFLWWGLRVVLLKRCTCPWCGRMGFWQLQEPELDDEATVMENIEVCMNSDPSSRNENFALKTDGPMGNYSSLSKFYSSTPFFAINSPSVLLRCRMGNCCWSIQKYHLPHVLNIDPSCVILWFVPCSQR